MKHSLTIVFLFIILNCSFAQIITDPNKELELVIDNYIDPFYFSQNSSEYQSALIVKKATDILIKHNIKQIKLIGYCSDQELKTHPTLSLERIFKIKELMKEFGYDPDSIKIQDVKNTQPVDWTGNNEENQRVEITILKA